MYFVELPSSPVDCKNLAGGTWQAIDGARAEVRSPYTGEVIGYTYETSSTQIHHILSLAGEAAKGWRATPLKERVQPLFRFRNLLLEGIDRVANMTAAESGKTVEEAKAGVLKGIEVVEYALSLENLDAGGAMEVSRGVTCQYRREPLGVVCGIVPFNFPAMVPLWMYPIALALGNSFVLKPSEKVPLTSQLIGELIVQAGFPAGVFSIVNGGASVVEQLIDHPIVKAVAFVGSTPVAKAVYQRATGHGKRALALGGAKNHLLVVPDAEPKITTSGVVNSFTGCAGQRCMAASLMVAVDDIEQHIKGIVSAATELKLGRDMGAIISKEAKDRICAMIARAEKDGARLLLDGRQAKAPQGYEGGYWLGPTIIDQATPDMECAKEEIFGPVLTIVRTKNLNDALDLENRNPFGNATSVFTSSGATANYVIARATNGMVGVNVGVPVPREPFSFGGTKASKFGHGDITGQGCLDFWTDQKKITQKWAIHSDATWMS